MGRDIVIGDVHGCADELETLLAEVQPNRDDHLVFVGDLINKGPDISRVIDLARSMQQVCKVTNLLGNHEEKLLRWLSHEQKRIESGVANPMQDRAGNLAALSSGLNEAQIQFLKSAKLWVRISSDAQGRSRIAIHAGIKPGLQELPAEDVDRFSLSARQRREVESLVRVRHVNAHGQPVPLGEEQTTDTFWADIYDGRFGLVIFGHEAVLNGELACFPQALGIDLGCVYGGHLAAVIFRPGVDRYETIRIKANTAYQPKRSIDTDD